MRYYTVEITITLKMINHGIIERCKMDKISRINPNRIPTQKKYELMHWRLACQINSKDGVCFYNLKAWL